MAFATQHCTVPVKSKSGTLPSIVYNIKYQLKFLYLLQVQQKMNIPEMTYQLQSTVHHLKIGYTVLLLASAVIVQSIYSTARTEERRRELAFGGNLWLGSENMQGIVWSIAKVWIYGLIFVKTLPIIMRFVPTNILDDSKSSFDSLRSKFM